MENIIYNISQVLGITIIHSLWQGLLIYFMLRLALTFGANLSSSKKYLFAVASLVAITGWFIYTLVNEIHIYNWLAVKPDKLSAMPLMLELPVNISQLSDQSIRYYYSIEGYLPYITLLYMLGLLFNTSRLILARKIINIIRQTMSIDVMFQQQLNRFTAILNITTKVKIGLSQMVDVPCMIGYFKPVILLPFTLSTYLSAEEIEAILLHELAHIKRNDYLVNLLQQVIGILLFFNPCMLLINKIINEERENCCDDLVVDATANPMVYAKALFKLEQTRENNLQLAMSAAGKKYQLLNRIERIMKTKKQTSSLRPALLAMIILTIGIGSIALLNPQIAQGKISVKAVTPIIKNLIVDTPHKSAEKKVAKKSVKETLKVTDTGYAIRRDNKTISGYKRSAYTTVADDKKMEELNAEISKHAEAISRYYQGGEFKTMQRELEKKSKELQEAYAKPQMKQLQEEMAQAGKEYSKTYGNSEEIKALSAQMGEAGKKMGAYYGSPEFKKMNEDLEKKYGIPQNHNWNDKMEKDENYKKYQAELDSRVPTEVKKESEELKVWGEKMRSHFESPEFKKQTEHMKILGDSMRKVYDNPAFKEQQKEMEKIGKQMGSYQNNPQLKKEQELLEQAVKKLKDYVKSPEFKNHINDVRTNYKGNFEEKEKKEKPEQKEKREQKEKPEQN
jgi:bla regulator protein BlaR1